MSLNPLKEVPVGAIVEVVVEGSRKKDRNGKRCWYEDGTFIGSIMRLPLLDERVQALCLLKIHKVENGSGRDPLFAKEFFPRWEEGKRVVPPPELYFHFDANKAPHRMINVLGFEAGEYLIPEELIRSIRVLGRNLQAWKSSDKERIEYLEGFESFNDRDVKLQSDLNNDRFPFEGDLSNVGNTQESGDTEIIEEGEIRSPEYDSDGY